MFNVLVPALLSTVALGAPEACEASAGGCKDSLKFTSWDHDYTPISVPYAKVVEGDIPTLQRIFTTLLVEGVVAVTEMPTSQNISFNQKVTRELNDAIFDPKSVVSTAVWDRGGWALNPSVDVFHHETDTFALEDFSYDPERAGPTAHNVIGNKELLPHTDEFMIPAGMGTRIKTVHCDFAEGAGMPDTVLVDGYHLLTQLSSKDDEALRTQEIGAYYFSERSNWTYSTQKKTISDVPNHGRPIISFNQKIQDHPATKFTPEGQSALARFTELLMKPENQARMNIGTGTMILMDNWRVMHGRTAGNLSARVLSGSDIPDRVFKRRLDEMFP